MNPAPVSTTRRPRIAFAIGCPVDIAPELTARLRGDPEVTGAAEIVAIGDRRVLDRGAKVAGVKLDLSEAEPDAALPSRTNRPVLVDLGNLDPATIPVGALSEPSGKSAIANFKYAIALPARGEADVVAFSPFNKASMRLGYPAYEDEFVFVTEMLDFTGTASEFNVLPNLWNARVTSHVSISGPAGRWFVDRLKLVPM